MPQLRAARADAKGKKRFRKGIFWEIENECVVSWRLNRGQWRHELTSINRDVALIFFLRHIIRTHLSVSRIDISQQFGDTICENDTYEQFIKKEEKHTQTK